MGVLIPVLTCRLKSSGFLMALYRKPSLTPGGKRVKPDSELASGLGGGASDLKAAEEM